MTGPGAAAGDARRRARPETRGAARGVRRRRARIAWIGVRIETFARRGDGTRRAAVVLALAPAGAAATSSSPSPATDEVVYRIGTTQDYDGFNPFTAWSGITWDSFRLCYDFLTWYKPDKNGGFDVAPDLATSWKTSADGKVWTFTIRPGMTWHDGVRLTARDVAFTYNWIIQTQNTTYIQYLVGVTSVEAPDDTTLVITCRRPSAGMLALYIPILPEHVWKKYADRDATAMEELREPPADRLGPLPGDRGQEERVREALGQSALPGRAGRAAQDRHAHVRDLAGRRRDGAGLQGAEPRRDRGLAGGVLQRPQGRSRQQRVQGAGDRLPRARLQLLEERQVQGRPSAARRRGAPGRQLGDRQAGDRRRLRGRPRHPRHVAHLAGAGHLALGRARGRAVQVRPGEGQADPRGRRLHRQGRRRRARERKG